MAGPGDPRRLESSHHGFDARSCVKSCPGLFHPDSGNAASLSVTRPPTSFEISCDELGSDCAWSSGTRLQPLPRRIYGDLGPLGMLGVELNSMSASRIDDRQPAFREVR